MNDRELTFWTTPPNFMLVATLNESVVGMVATQKKSDTVCELNRLSVRQEVNGLGIGSALVKAAVAHAAEAGYGGVYLSTSDIHKTAIRIYERIGFRRMGLFHPDLELYGFSFPKIFHGIIIREYLYTIEK